MTVPFDVKPQPCTDCGSLDVVTIDGINGRRCAACPPTLDPAHLAKLETRGLPGSAGAYARTHLPPGRFDRDLALDMVDGGRADAAFIYLRAWLARRISERFALARSLLRRKCWCRRPINDPGALECAEHA